MPDKPPISRGEIGARIRSLRGSRSQESFARSIGVRPGTLSRYEQGKLLNVKTLMRIAAEGGTTVDWLLGGKHENSAPRPESQDQVVEAALAAFGAVLGPVDARDREMIEQHLRTQMRILVEWALSRAPHGQVGRGPNARKESPKRSAVFKRRRAGPRGDVRTH